jgi:hypothetical protein
MARPAPRWRIVARARLTNTVAVAVTAAGRTPPIPGIGGRPFGRRPVRERDRHAEESLSHAGMSDRHRSRQQEQHGQATQRPLRHHERERGPGQASHAGPTLGQLGPDREDEREEADRGRDHAVAVLVEDAPDHRGHQHPVGEGPVRNGEAGPRARHEPPREHEYERAHRERDREAVPDRGVLILHCRAKAARARPGRTGREGIWKTAARQRASAAEHPAATCRIS